VSAGASDSPLVPLAINGAYGGFFTHLSVFNGGSSAVTATVTFYNADGSPAPSPSVKTLNLASHTTTVLDQSNVISQLPNNFNGWAQITAPTGSQLVAQILEQNPNTHFVAIASGISTTQDTVYAPAIFNKAFGSFTTGANVINPSNTPITVTISYFSSDGTGYSAPAFALNPHQVAPIYHGSQSGVGVPIGGLPSGFSGSALVVANYPNKLAMVVNENGGLTANGTAESGVYNAALNGSDVLGLPVMANGGFGYTTGTTIENIDTALVNVFIQYYNLDGTKQGPVQQVMIPGHGSVALYQGAAGLPPNFYGTALVFSSQLKSLIATTNAISSSFFYTFTEGGE
jgi:hypothetical protein